MQDHVNVAVPIHILQHPVLCGSSLEEHRLGVNDGRIEVNRGEDGHRDNPMTAQVDGVRVAARFDLDADRTSMILSDGRRTGINLMLLRSGRLSVVGVVDGKEAYLNRWRGKRAQRCRAAREDLKRAAIY